jgi:transposase
MPWAHGKLNQHAKVTLVTRVCHQRVSVAEAARMANISRSAAYRWLNRYRLHGLDGLLPGSRRPLHSPRAVAAERVARIEALRRETGRGPQWIGALLGMPTSTVHRVLTRLGLHRLNLLDRVTRAPVRYEYPTPGELVHLDVKKLQRVPPGGGRHFDPLWQHLRRTAGHGADYLHVAIDDHSRYLYVEALPDQKAPRPQTSSCGRSDTSPVAVSRSSASSPTTA